MRFITLITLSLTLGCSGKTENMVAPPGDDEAEVLPDEEDDADADAATDDTGSAAIDADGDGFSAPEDCDDSDPARSPGRPEICDGVDNDCNDLIDEAPVDPSDWYLDHDGDGYGDPDWVYTDCEPLDGYVADGTDCNDDSDLSYPGSVEVCDGIDNDCDDEIDEGGTLTVFEDDDGDGFGDTLTTISDCDPTDGTAELGGDCDDSSADIYPGAPDTPYDGIDSDCDGGSDYDVDGDGYDHPDGGGSDCDDTESTVFAGAEDEPYDGVDSDCAGDDDFDDDGDGYVPDEYVGIETTGVGGSGSLPGGDCDDTDPDRHPGMEEVSDDGVDSDCDGEDSSIGLTGETGDAWVAVGSGPSMRGLQEYLDVGAEYMYVGQDSYFSRMHIDSESWETLPSAPGSLAYWGSAALGSDGGIWQLRQEEGYRYDVDSGSWSTVYGLPNSGGDEQSMTVSDRDGNLWVYQGGTLMLRYDPLTGVADAFTIETTPYSYEMRMGYDPGTHSIVFGGFAESIIYRYDIATGVTDTTLTPHPESMLNDIYCSDRNGHIYAAGMSGGTTLWQYTISTDTWNPIPDYPEDHGNNGSCSVSLDGWLYMEPGSVSTIYKLPLY